MLAGLKGVRGERGEGGTCLSHTRISLKRVYRQTKQVVQKIPARFNVIKYST